MGGPAWCHWGGLGRKRGGHTPTSGGARARPGPPASRGRGRWPCAPRSAPRGSARSPGKPARRGGLGAARWGPYLGRGGGHTHRGHRNGEGRVGVSTTLPPRIPPPRRPPTHCEAARGRKAGGRCRARGPGRPRAAARVRRGSRGAAPVGQAGGRRAGDPPKNPPPVAHPAPPHLRGRGDVLGAQEQAGEVAGQPQALEVPDEVPVDDGVTVHQLRLRQELAAFILHQTFQLLPQHQWAQVGKSHPLRPPRHLWER